MLILAEIPTITVSRASDEGELEPDASLLDCMGPPSTAGPSGDLSQTPEQHPEELENEDGVIKLYFKMCHFKLLLPCSI